MSDSKQYVKMSEFMVTESKSNKRVIIGTVPISPDGGWGWIIVIASFLIHVITDGFVYSFGVIVPDLIEQMNAHHSATGWILSTLLGLTLGIGPIASAVTNQFGCRATTIAGALIASFGCGISYFANSVFYLMLSIGIVMGIGFGLIYCPAIVVVTMYFERRRGLATGIAVCGAGVGTFLYAPLNAFLISQFSVRTALLVHSVIILNCVLCGAVFRPLKFEPAYADELSDEDSDNDEKELLKNGDMKSLSQEKLDEEQQIASEHNGGVIRQYSNSVQKDDRLYKNPLLQTLISDNLQSNSQPGSHSNLMENGNADRSLRAYSHLALPQSALPCRRYKNSVDCELLQVSAKRINERLDHADSTGYLNIRDVFYTGSVTNLHHRYQSDNRQTARNRAISSMSYIPNSALRGTSHLNIHVKKNETTTSAELVLHTDQHLIELDRDMEKERIGSCGVAKRIIGEMVKPALLKNAAFVIFAISNFLTSAGMNPPLLFLDAYAQDEHQISKDESFYALQAYGIANTLGRIVFGFAADRILPCRYGKNTAANRFWLYNILILSCGIVTLCSRFATTLPTLLIFAAFFGISISCYICLTSVLLVDILGIDQLTSGFGMLLLFQGAASLIGAPIVGFVIEAVSYGSAFDLCGLSMLLSGIIMYIILFLPSSQRQFKCRVSDDNERNVDNMSLKQVIA